MIWGDPHIVTFDLMAKVKSDFDRERIRNRGGKTHWKLGEHLVPDVFKKGTYWAVKSERILVQGRYSRHRGYALRGVAVGGPFMRGHKLALDDILLQGRPVLTWDGKDVFAKSGFQNALVKVQTKYASNRLKSAEMTLPEGVTISVKRYSWNNNRGASVQVTISMREQQGGQDGQCGQADGTFPEDRHGYVLERWGTEVPRSEQLFPTAYSLLSSLQESGAEHEAGETEPSAAEICAAERPLPEAIQACDAALNGTATALGDILRQGCLVDVCASGVEAALAVAEVARDATATLKEGWYDGGERRSCDEGCQAVGLVCTEEQLFAHNHEVDSTQKIMDLVAELGGSTYAQHCDQMFGTADDVPNWSLGVCHGSSPSRALATWSCSARPRGFHPERPKHRLCYCHNP